VAASAGERLVCRPGRTQDPTDRAAIGQPGSGHLRPTRSGIHSCSSRSQHPIGGWEAPPMRFDSSGVARLMVAMRERGRLRSGRLGSTLGKFEWFVR
jgi:hypothetical protein